MGAYWPTASLHHRQVITVVRSSGKRAPPRQTLDHPIRTPETSGVAVSPGRRRGVGSDHAGAEARDHPALAERNHDVATFGARVDEAPSLKQARVDLALEQGSQDTRADADVVLLALSAADIEGVLVLVAAWTHGIRCASGAPGARSSSSISSVSVRREYTLITSTIARRPASIAS